MNADTTSEQPSWIDKIAASMAWMTPAHRAMMLEKIRRQNRSVEVLSRNTMTGDMSNTGGLPIEGDDDMGVSVGNEIHYHMSDPAPSTLSASKASESGKHRLWPYILAAAMGIPAGAAGTYYLMREPGLDTVIEYQPSFGEPQYRSGHDEKAN